MTSFLRFAAAAPLVLGVTFAAWAGLQYAALRFGAPFALSLLALAPAALLGGLAARAEPDPLPFRSAADVRLSAGIVGLGCAWAFLLFGWGELLRPGDAIAAPQFAQVLAGGRLLTEAFPPGSSAYSYPPGYPVLLAPLAAALDPIALLTAFKFITVLTVALIPAAWGWLHVQLFERERPTWLVLGAAYAAFVTAERHLGFLTAYAGKNAVQFALLLAPFVMAASLRWTRSWRTLPLAVAALFGLYLIHYSMAHLTAALLGAFALLSGRLRLWDMLRLGLAGLGAVGLLLAVIPEAAADPRAGGLAWAPLTGLQHLADLVLAERPALVIFHDDAFGLWPSPFRLILLAALVALTIALGLRRKDGDLARSAGVYGLALLVSLLFAFSVIPARINLDFVRSYVWAVQAMIVLAAGLAVAREVFEASGPARGYARGLAALAVLGLLATAAHDARYIVPFFHGTATPEADLREVQAALPEEGACWLIGDSEAQPLAMVVTMETPGWNYAEAVTPCRYLNGSWVQPGVPRGREAGGLPAGDVLAQLPARDPVYFVGPRARLNALQTALSERGAVWGWRLADPEVAGEPLWEADRP